MISHPARRWLSSLLKFESSAVDQVRTHTLLDSLFIYSYFEHYYGYLLLDKRTKQIAAIDCGDYKTSRLNVERLMKLEGASFTHILLTHEHANHCSGCLEWAEVHPGLRIVASRWAQKKFPFCSYIDEGDNIQLGDLLITPIRTLGHSVGSMCYLVREFSPVSTKTPVLFTGDTLMVGACGRVSDTNEMFDSFDKIKKLPAETVIFPGHEHALESLTFAKLLDPSNKVLTKKLDWAKSRRSQGDFAIGSLLGEELLYNPFLRCDQLHFLDQTSTTDPRACFSKLWTLMDKLVVS